MIHILPDEIILKILSYLDHKDLVSCSSVCSNLRNVCNTPDLWKTQNQKFWLLKSCEQKDAWKSEFIYMYKEFGRYINDYSKIKTAWDKILAYLSKHSEEILYSVNEGATEAQIHQAESKSGSTFPIDFCCSIRLHNGQNISSEGLIGSISIHTHVRSEKLLEIDFASSCELSLSGCIPLTCSFESGVTQYLALSDINGLEPGTVFYPSNVKTSRGVTTFNAFISGKTFTDWLTKYSNHLYNGDYVYQDEQISRFTNACDSPITTGAITVSAKTCFMPEFSEIETPAFFHTYQITLRMAKEVPSSLSCQLETRHWVIIDENGKEEHVNGPGVVGDFPILRPGSNYSWVSCTSFSTTYGSMRGHFRMRNLATGKKENIICPTFHMKSLPYVIAAQCNAPSQASKEVRG